MSASAQTGDDLNAILDFQATLESLHEALHPSPANDAPVADLQKFLVLDGTVAAISVIDSNPETYQVVIELVKGEWEGLERVNSYRAMVQFEGPDYVDVFPARRPRNPSPLLITPNTRVLVIGYVADPGDESQELFFLIGLGIRRAF